MIHHRMLAEKADVEDLLRGMAEARRIMGQAAMASILVSPFDEESSCRSDDDWAEFVRSNVTYGVHPVGTCRMGRDDLAVVDPELRVCGVEGLRVADASIMPTVTSGNTNAPTMMIGERAAALLNGGTL
jgi:choline dehydrogenase